MVANNRNYPVLPIPKLSRSLMLWQNAMADKHDVATVSLGKGGLSFQVNLFPLSSLDEGLSFGILFQVDGVPAPVWFSSWPLEKRVRKLISGGDITRVPADLRSELVETALKPLLEPLRKKTKAKIKVINFLTHKPTEVGDMSIGFNLVDSHNNQTKIIMVMHEKLAPVIEKMMRHWPSRGGHQWEQHVTALWLEVGSTDLTIQELARIDLGDVLMMDRSEDIQNHKLCLRNGSGNIYKAKLSTHQLILESGMVTMSDETQTEKLNSIDDIPVRLSFDLGEIILPFSAVKGLTEGSVVDLNQPISQAVTIRSSNKIVGFGELVDIDGKKGIRISNLFSNGKVENSNG